MWHVSVVAVKDIKKTVEVASLAIDCTSSASYDFLTESRLLLDQNFLSALLAKEVVLSKEAFSPVFMRLKFLHGLGRSIFMSLGR